MLERTCVKFAMASLAIALLSDAPGAALQTAMHFTTRYASLDVDRRGFIVSILARSSGKEYSPAGHPSPLLCIEGGGKTLPPSEATYDRKRRQITLRYASGAVAVVKAVAKSTYFRFQLLSLEPRIGVDNVVWGPINTTVSGRIGDIIGVVRDKDWAIGMLGIDDNTIAGPPVDGDAYSMAYYVHSLDPEQPVPPPYSEGQWFNVGGNGTSDVAFYSRPEEFLHQVAGNGAKLEPEFGSSVVYHSRDRRKTYVQFYSLLPGFQASRPRHLVTDPVDADFIGSTVALYACSDDRGLKTLESIILAEGLPYIAFDGKWVRDISTARADVAWWGPHDKAIEYTTELGLKAIADEEQGSFYPNPANHRLGPEIVFSDGRKQTYRQFTDEAARSGIKYGLHTLCLFLQADWCSDVSPAASEHLQTVCRSKLAESITADDERIVVTDPSFLAEDGTWPMRDGFNFVRIGTEIVRYQGVTDRAPYALLNVQRGYSTKARPHFAGDVVAKLQMNCYQGFAPDMKLMLDYADHYATVLAENGMEYVNLDGFESTFYQGHGYYAVRVFMRRLFDSYAKSTGGKHLRVTGSAVPAGAWEYFSICNVGGNANMFDPVENRWGIEGKDIRNAWSNSYFPPTFGLQNYHSDWTVYDAENLQAKAIGWDATFTLGLTEDAVERSGEKKAIFKAFRAWEDARVAGVFDAKTKEELKDLGLKFHLEQREGGGLALCPVKEIRTEVSAGGAESVAVDNPFGKQPLHFALRFGGPASGIVVTLPDGQHLTCEHRIEQDQFVICKGDRAYLADRNRVKIGDLDLARPAVLPQGAGRLSVESADRALCELRVWALGKTRVLRGKVK
jgi:hypothetical protein